MDPNPYRAPSAAASAPLELVLRPGETWPPICVRCGAGASGLTTVRLVVLRKSALRVLALVAFLGLPWVLRDRVEGWVMGAIVLVMGLGLHLLQPRLDVALPHCPTCAARALKAQKIQRFIGPLTWVAIACMWGASGGLVTLAAGLLIVGFVLWRKLEPRRLIVKQAEPELQILGADPTVAARVAAAIHADGPGSSGFAGVVDPQP